MSNDLNGNKNIDQQIPRIFFLGILWGVLELFVAARIKALQPALAGITIPFVIILFILVAKYFAPTRGTILLMAIIPALFEFFFAGMILHGPFMAILLEAFLAEVAFTLLGFRIVTFLSTGVLIELYSAFHPLLSRGVFCQSGHFVKFERWLVNLLWLGLPEEISRSTITFILLSFHIFAGILAGLLGWVIVQYMAHKRYS